MFFDKDSKQYISSFNGYGIPPIIITEQTSSNGNTSRYLRIVPFIKLGEEKRTVKSVDLESGNQKQIEVDVNLGEWNVHVGFCIDKAIATEMPYERNELTEKFIQDYNLRLKTCTFWKYVFDNTVAKVVIKFYFEDKIIKMNMEVYIHSNKTNHFVLNHESKKTWFKRTDYFFEVSVKRFWIAVLSHIENIKVEQAKK